MHIVIVLRGIENCVQMMLTVGDAVNPKTQGANSVRALATRAWSVQFLKSKIVAVRHLIYSFNDRPGLAVAYTL